MTTKIINPEITNLKEKLSNCRSLCLGLNEEVYALCDYLATTVNDSLTPTGLAIFFTLSLDDITKGISSFNYDSLEKTDNYLVTHKSQVLAQSVYFPQFIDEIADEDFANEFRKICKETMQIDPPKREKNYNPNEEISGNHFPEYITIATNWWANAIVNPKFDNGDDAFSFLTSLIASNSEGYTKEQINDFKNALAEIIYNELKISYDKSCHLRVDYHPDYFLSVAAQKAGINQHINFPWKTHMIINKENVIVSPGYGAPYETLWSKTN